MSILASAASSCLVIGKPSEKSPAGRGAKEGRKWGDTPPVLISGSQDERSCPNFQTDLTYPSFCKMRYLFLVNNLTGSSSRRMKSRSAAVSCGTECAILSVGSTGDVGQ
jgi:hypothetical protein